MHQPRLLNLAPNNADFLIVLYLIFVKLTFIICRECKSPVLGYVRQLRKFYCFLLFYFFTVLDKLDSELSKILFLLFWYFPPPKAFFALFLLFLYVIIQICSGYFSGWQCSLGLG